MTQTVLITGAAKGIGAACARAFARSGARVAIHYHKSQAPAEALCAQLRAQGCDAQAFGGDLSSSAAADALIAQVQARFGAIDVLVCNAGIAEQALLPDIDDTAWRAMLDSNLSSVFYCCRAALPAMIGRKRGKIITISSVWGLRGAACEVHYSASKAAVIGLTRALAQEVGPSGITVNCVAPGVIDTDMCADFDAQTMADLAEQTPLGRIGRPEDVAGVVHFLSTNAADFVTGQVLAVDGGFAL